MAEAEQAAAAAAAKKPASGPTPMMAQYLEIKTANPDCLLFYRMGDFYELFFEDAEIASRALGITLTKRGKHGGDDIPMCGVPVHAADEYLQRLIRLDHKVAVCEQTEDPAEAKKRGAKAVVRREVVRLVTPGTLTEDSLLDARRNNFLSALARNRGDGTFALAWIDISTGDFTVTPTAAGRLAAELSRIEPSEIVVPDSVLEDQGLSVVLNESGATVSPLPASRFDSASAERRVKDFFGVAALESFGDLGRAEIAACGVLIDYITLTQVGKVPAIRPPVLSSTDDVMLIDAATRTNLELVRTLAGERRGSLLSVIDRTETGPGGRMLSEWLSAPLRDPEAIAGRQDAVGYLIDQPHLADDLRGQLKACPDIARALSRLTVGRGGPRDLAGVRDGLKAARDLMQRLNEENSLAGPPRHIAAIAETLGADDAGLWAELGDILTEDLPLMARDGGFVCAGCSADLDEARALRDESRKVIAGLQAGYAEETEVSGLKIKHNNVLGYFIEVTARHGETLISPPHNARFIHRQTMANAMRFTTTELTELESKISAAGDKALRLELEIFERLVERVVAQGAFLTSLAMALASLDVFAGLAELARERRYCRPLVDGSQGFKIEGGRHPVVEQALTRAGDAPFVPNDCELSADVAGRIWLLTGPNMAGKSTFLRQNALIAILAQIGSFVPAVSAHIGIVDRLFSRVGAADDLARGRSTFMVEMVETATILNQATNRSLVILDEIGRGTATFDGLSIAWACVEHLHEVNRCRALFATHFHELTALSERLESLSNATMKVREFKGDVVFLHEVGPGAADRSYGIQVAKLAGLPSGVIERASEVLALLEEGDQKSGSADLAADLPLFAAPRPQSTAPARGPSELERVVFEALPDEMSPRDALEFVYKLKQVAGEQS
ncbi:MAG: DNA mismatch repair protein MutS [Pseudomonadota bacterium]